VKDGLESLAVSHGVVDVRMSRAGTAEDLGVGAIIIVLGP
jgi:hypothetical protein